MNIGDANWQRVILAAAVLVVAIVAYLALDFGRPGGRAANGKESAGAVPVMASEVRRADVPVYLAGLGTVQAFNSVRVITRVDGPIVKIDFTEGQDVRAGDALAEIDPQTFEAALAQTQAVKLRDQAQLDNARLDLARFTRLIADQAATTQQRDTSRALVAQLSASMKADAAQADLAALQLRYTHIVAPIDGRVGMRLVDVGNIVHATDTAGIVTINQVHPIFVAFSLPGATLPDIRTALKDGAIPVTAEDANGHTLATGKLSVIDNQISAVTATISYKAVFDNTNDALWPGQFVDVRMLLRTLKNATVVPVTAVLYGPEGTYAFVVARDHSVAKRAIAVGFANNALAVVTSGLSLGERVVSDGQYRLVAGTVVEILPSPASPKSAYGAAR
jgi:multidrug efflux system membrane fusion protein